LGLDLEICLKDLKKLTTTSSIGGHALTVYTRVSKFWSWMMLDDCGVLKGEGRRARSRQTDGHK
jgi:hypothetical protein